MLCKYFNSKTLLLGAQGMSFDTTFKVLLRPSQTPLAGGGLGHYLLESGCILMGPVLHQVSDLEADCVRLPCHTRLSNPIQTCLQQWGYHRLLQEEQVTANHL